MATSDWQKSQSACSACDSGSLPKGIPEGAPMGVLVGVPSGKSGSQRVGLSGKSRRARSRSGTSGPCHGFRRERSEAADSSQQCHGEELRPERCRGRPGRSTAPSACREDRDGRARPAPLESGHPVCGKRPARRLATAAYRRIGIIWSVRHPIGARRVHPLADRSCVRDSATPIARGED
jgi:hypothetical protein